MIRRPPRSTQSRSSAASDVYKRQDRALLVEVGPRGSALGGRHRHTPFSAWTQRTKWPASTSTISGCSVSQLAILTSQRGQKPQPAGGLTRLGGSPLIELTISRFSWMLGKALMSRRV